MKHHRSIRGLVLAFGVALGLIGTAGAASAQEAPPASDNEATIGEAYFVERPAPRPDPANELGAATPAAPTPAPVPAPAPAPTPAPAVSGGGAGVATAPEAVNAATAPAVRSPARATQVQGVQLERPASPATAPDGGATLAYTGADDVGLAVLAVVLLVLGTVLVRISRPVRTS